MNVLSLFDGMACGMIAAKKLGLQIDSYHAYEIDKYAIQTATHNFPEIIEHGDVFKADFSQYKNIDFIWGGSPCTYWSIAQKEHRETTASGLGWELFSQYVRALKEVKPKYFIYENNKSMSNAIRDSIRETFGFEEICINSALVSAQNRNRYYWVGKYNPQTDWYDKVEINQPEDKGIKLVDILDSLLAEPLGLPESSNKSLVLTVSYYKYAPATVSKKVKPRMGIAEPVSTSLKIGCMPSPNGTLKNSQGMRIYSIDAKSVTQSAQGGGLGGKTGLYAIPVCVAQRGRYDENGKIYQHYEVRTNEKTSVLTTVSKDNLVAEPVPYYAIACEWDENGNPIKAISGANRKAYKVYKVANGVITIKDKPYPTKLQDGYWIIRNLTINESKRLQTVPDWFEFPVSNSQAAKQLGNGWTVDVIAHLIKFCLNSDKR